MATFKELTGVLRALLRSIDHGKARRGTTLYTRAFHLAWDSRSREGLPLPWTPFQSAEAVGSTGMVNRVMAITGVSRDEALLWASQQGEGP